MRSIANILKKPIVKVSSLNSVSLLVRIVGGLVTSKAIAIYVGAGGLTLVENLRNFLTQIEFFSTMGMQNGIIKYVAENQKQQQKLYKILCTVFLSLLGSILFISLLLLFFSGSISQWVFLDYNQHAWVFKVLAFSLPWYAGSLIFMAIINGLGDYKKVIWLNISGNILGAVISTFLMWKFNIDGALLGLILFQALFFILSFYNLWMYFPGMPFISLKYFDFKILRSLLSYSVMALFTAILGPTIYIAIRNTIADNFSPATAGYWVGMTRLSSYYMMFASTMLTVYFLPKLSMAQTSLETRKVFMSYYKSILPLFAIGLCLLYFLREFVVLFVFKEEFLPMTQLFVWQLLGDFFKVGSLILGYQFFAKKMTKAYIVTEILSSLIIYFSSILFLKKFGIDGAVIAHATTYFIYWIILLLYFRKDLFGIKSEF